MTSSADNQDKRSKDHGIFSHRSATLNSHRCQQLATAACAKTVQTGHKTMEKARGKDLSGGAHDRGGGGVHRQRLLHRRPPWAGPRRHSPQSPHQRWRRTGRCRRLQWSHRRCQHRCWSLSCLCWSSCLSHRCPGQSCCLCLSKHRWSGGQSCCLCLLRHRWSGSQSGRRSRGLPCAQWCLCAVKG